MMSWGMNSRGDTGARRAAVRSRCRWCDVPRLAWFLSVAFVFPSFVLGQATLTGPSDQEKKSSIVIQSAPIAEIPRLLTNERPVKRELFEEFLKTRRFIRNDDQAVPSTVMITSSHYDARFASDGHLQGTGRIAFQSTAGQPIAVPTPLFSLAVSELKWKDRDDPVLWGLAPDQRLVVIVPSSGELQFDWSSTAAKSSRGRFEFDLGLIEALNTEVIVSSPRNWTPRTKGDLITSAIANDANELRHSIRIGRSGQAHIVFENSLASDIANPPHWVRMSNRYEVGRQGIDLVAELEIETTGSPLSKLPLRVDDSLQLVSARMGDQNLAWTVIASSPERSIELQFDPPLTESGRKVRIEGRAALSGDQMASLPRLRPSGGALREAEVLLNIAPPLELVGIELQGARFADTGSVFLPRGGESRRVLLQSPEADIRCAFRTPTFRGKVRYNADVKLNESTWELDASLRMNIESGERFELSTKLPVGWIIDSVESTPAGAIENWVVATEPLQQRLSLRLQRALSPKAPLSLRINAHMPRVGNDSTSSKQFWLANFDGIALDDAFLHLQTGPGIQLGTATDAPRLRPTELGANDLEAFATKPTGAIYRFSPQREFFLTHSAVGAEFRVTSASRVQIDRDRIVRQHRITVTPQRQQLARLLVRLAPATGEEAYFELPDSPLGSLAAKLLGSDAQGDLWELRFSEPIGAEFTVAVMESTSQNSRPRIRTIHCESASTQESTLRVFSDSERTWDISSNGAEPILRQQSTLSPWFEIASLRYGLTDNPEVTLVRREVSRVSAPIWAWEEERASYVSQEPQSVHVSRFRLECQSVKEATFRMPAESKVLEVRVDRQPITTFRVADSVLHVPLTGSLVNRLVEIRVAAPQNSFDYGIARLQWDGVTPRFPCLSQRWAIWTPPGFGVAPYPLQLRWNGAFALWAPSANDRRFELATDVTSAPALGFVDVDQLRQSGWVSTHLKGQLQPSLRLLCIFDLSWRVAGWCVMIVSLLLSYSVFGRSTRLRAMVVALGICFGLASCFVPEPIGLLFSGCFLGVLVTLLLRGMSWIRVPHASGLPIALAPSRAGLAILVGFWVWNGTPDKKSISQEILAASKVVAAKPTRNVLDPIDDEGKPAGDFVYVSPELFEEMALAGPTQAIDSCLMKEIRYRISRTALPPTDSLVLSVEYSYFATADSQVVPLLADPQLMQNGQQEVFVDGERKDLPNRSESRSLQIELMGRGPHSIRIDVKLPLRLEGDFATCQWRTPPVPKQLLEIETDSSLVWQRDGIEIRHDPISRTAKIALSPSRELKLGVRRVNPIAAVSEISARHDAWITVSSGSVSMENLVRVGTEPPANSIEFELDEGVSLDSVMGNNRRVITPIAISDRRFRVPLESPADGDAEIRILCSQKTGLGFNRLVSPGIQFPEVKLTETRIGVSASAEFQLQAELRAGVSDLAVAQFVQGWPQGKTPPRVAIVVEPGKNWVIEILPAISQVAVSQQTEYVIRRTDLLVQWDAEIAASGEPSSLYFIQVPPALQLDSISVLEASVNRLVRFARTSPDRVSLLMRTASTEPRQIRLRGSLPITPAKPVSLPVLNLENAAVSSSLLKVFREDETQVELTQTQGLRMLDPAARAQAVVSIIQPERSRLVGEWEVLAPTPGIEAQVIASANAPQMAHESTVRFETRDSKWRLDQSIKLTIQSGVVDELVFDLPKGLREPLEITPSMPFQIVRKENESAQLVVRPEQAWKETRELRIAGEYLPEFGDAELSLASIRLLQSKFQLGWIAAPKQAGSGVFAWKGIGSEEVPTPQGQLAGADFQWFQQRDDSATVRLQRSTINQRVTSARLLGAIALQNERYVGAFTWFWGSASAPKVELVSPEGLRILRVRVVGSSARVTQLSDLRWQMTTAPGSAPPSLEVVFTGDFEPAAPIAMPQLEGATTQEAHITVHSEREWEAGSQFRDNLLSASDGFQTRLRILDQSKRDAQTVLPTLGEQESTNWRRSWLVQWDAARTMTPPGNGVTNSQGASIPKWLQEADADRARFLSSPNESAADSTVAESSNFDLHVADSVVGVFAEKTQALHFYEEGKAPTIQLARRRAAAIASDSIRSTLESYPWMLPSMALGLLVVLLALSSPSRRSLFLRIIPIMSWIVLGLTWWLWFAPFWLGPLIAVLALFSFLVSAAQSWSRRKLGGAISR